MAVPTVRWSWYPHRWHHRDHSLADDHPPFREGVLLDDQISDDDTLVPSASSRRQVLRSLVGAVGLGAVLLLAGCGGGEGEEEGGGEEGGGEGGEEEDDD